MLDEAPVEDAIVMLGHDAGASPTEGWSTYRLRFDAGEDACRSDDAEVVTVRADGGTVGATLVHDFGDLRKVEGVADGIDGHHLYVVDEESGVQMRFLLLE